jgi:opacity protein-like surface antigen
MKPLSIFFVLLVLMIANANAATCADAVATTLPTNSEVVNMFQCNPDQGDAKPVCFVVAKVSDGQYLYQTVEDSVVINSATTKTVQIVGLHAKYSTATGDSKITSTFWPNASLLIMDNFVRKGFFSGYQLKKSNSYTCQ